MRRDASLKRRLGHVATLQAIQATSSRSDLAEAQASHAEAVLTLSAKDVALGIGTQEINRLLAAETFDFDRWRIGGAVIGDLARAHDAANKERYIRETDEDECRAKFAHENAREEHARALHRAITRRLGEKRDEADTLEAGAIASLRQIGARR